MRTALLCFVFALSLDVSAAKRSQAETAEAEYRRAVGLREAISSTTNSVRIAFLGLDLEKALETALAANPDHVPARIELVRYLVNAPEIAGGGVEKARAEAAEIARRDEAAGHFAAGYIAYREKQFGVARIELRAAADGATTALVRSESLTWLGWLSQESQQWDEAFATWERLLASDPARTDALYEIGRTSAFCGREKPRGIAALERYLRLTKRSSHRTEATKLLAKLR